jgi:phosphoenolpyruvate-protein phosphotransferase
MDRQNIEVALVAPLSGPAVALQDVPDPVFAQRMLGDGIAIDPLNDALVAPCDGTIVQLARTGHALTLRTAAGAEILLHIGIDTVALDGEGFVVAVAEGDRVAVGQTLIRFMPDYIACHAPSLVSVIAVANSDAFEIVQRATGMLEAGRSPLLTLRAVGGIAPSAGAHARSPVSASGPDACRASVTLDQPGGLHARPAARVRNAARRFSAQLEMHYEGRHASLLSVVGLLGLGARQGSRVEIVSRGADARAALDAVVDELQATHVEETAPQAASVATSRAPLAPPGADGAAPAPNTLAGVGASPGIAVGVVVRWGQDDGALPEFSQRPSSAESRRLDQALAAVDAELDATVRAASNRGAVSEAGIFAVHRILLEDPALLDTARDLISLGKSAAFAWREAIRAQTTVLAGLADTLLAERAADLRDLEKRVVRALGDAPAGAPRVLPRDAVLAAEEFTPSDLSGLDLEKVVALITARGGPTSHAAIIARQLGLPALVAIGDPLYAIAEGTTVVVDANAGRLEHAPGEVDIRRARAERERLRGVRESERRLSAGAAVTRDGRAIEVAANIATLDDAHTAVANGADAVGLLRTELLFIHRQHAPTVEEHRLSYQAISDALDGRSAIIRTLDVGADKEVDYLSLPPEPNPALGLRGVRLAQVRPDLLDDQLRGLLAVQPAGAVRILLPMITDAGELVRLRERIDVLAAEAGRTDAIEVGVMIEVPSAALLADQLARHADFLSIGTNDLTQYTLAMDRLQADLARQADGLHPGVLRMIAAAVQGAALHGRWVGVCGALAGDPVAVPILVGLGVTELSVDPPVLPMIKARVRELDYQLCRQRAEDALALESAQAVRQLSREVWPGV